MAYVSNDCRMYGSAWVAVRHWDGYGAPVHVFDFGAMDTSCDSVRLDRERCFAGLARALEKNTGVTARTEKLGKRIAEIMVDI